MAPAGTRPPRRPKKQKPNDRCGCGSGKKYKKCCWLGEQTAAHAEQEGGGAAGGAAAGGAARGNVVMGEAELRRRAEAGDAQAGCELGEALMARGEAAEAVKWVRWAAEEKAYTPAMMLLGVWYIEGKGVPQDELESNKWLRRACETAIERGVNVEASKAMLVKTDASISLLTGGAGPSGDGDGLEAELRRLAEAGDADAGRLLGQTLMARGEAAEAVKWVRWAAEEKGDEEAMGLLGRWYMQGKGVPQDELEAFKWWRRAYETNIERGIDVEHYKAMLVKADARINLLTGGAGPSGDVDGLEAALRRLAEAGDAEAGCVLGETLMARGEEGEAVKWMRWAAEEKGDADAMRFLGRWYIEGKGVPQDKLEGYKWLRRYYETCIEQGVNVETNKANLVKANAEISLLTGGTGPSGGDDGLEAELRRLAEAGDAEAGRLLGQTLMARGEEAEALKWVRWAAEEKGYARAMGLLGDWYYDGKGVPQDELEGYKWARRYYETCIEQGVNVEANKARLVACDAKISHLTGGAVPSGDGDGLEAAMRRRAEAGDAEAGYELGEALMARGEEAEAVKWVRWAAEEKGDAEAMNLLVTWYLEGKGVPQDELESYKWARRASKRCIERGDNVEANKAVLVKTDAMISLLTGGAGPSGDGDGLETELRRLAEAGDAEAGCVLGKVLMARGEEAEAVKWVRWAAEEKGNVNAMNLLGNWYIQGKGVPQDKLEGHTWLRRSYETAIEQGVNVEANKAMLVKTDAQISLLTGGAGPSGDGDGLEAELRCLAEAGNAQAGCLLGQKLMARGEEAEAVKWVRWAVDEKGDALAMGLLGSLYFDGKGVPQDKLESCKWMRRHFETFIEQGVNVEANKASLVKIDAKISHLTSGAGPSGDGDGLEAELRRLAEAGDAKAGYELGEALMARGEEAEAVKWVRWAADEKGDADAMWLLAGWYLEGKGVPQDELEGCKWARRASKTCIERGDNVEASKAMLVKANAEISLLTGGAGPSGDGDGLEAELRRLAEAGDAQAGRLLGQTLMARGEEGEAVKWMRWAAEEKGHARAMRLLASWYNDGKGVPQDKLEGCKWARRYYETAIEQGVDVELNKATVAAYDARICKLSDGPDVSSANRAAVKKLKAALEKNPENEDLRTMLDSLKLLRVCDGCGASARDEGVRLSICTRCRQAFFCSQACLERSFERHEPDCTRLRAQRKRERAEAAKKKEAEQGEEREEAEAKQEETQQRCDNGGGDDAGPSTE